ncbi:MAG TPA: LPS export ABC transporter periplasmic protein LptC [Steroidobacteraceae bacterium]
MIYRIFAILAIVAVIVASLLLAGQQNGAPSSTTVRRTPGDEGYSAQNARVVQAGADGLPLYTVNAATIRQLPDQDQVQLTQVQMTFRDRNGVPWSATADQGTLQQAAGQIALSGNVHVSGTPPDSPQPAQISTDALAVDLHSYIVTTHDPVILLWAGRRESAVGLSANLKDYRVDLESAVHGTFPQ